MAEDCKSLLTNWKTYEKILGKVSMYKSEVA